MANDQLCLRKLAGIILLITALTLLLDTWKKHTVLGPKQMQARLWSASVLFFGDFALFYHFYKKKKELGKSYRQSIQNFMDLSNYQSHVHDDTKRNFTLLLARLPELARGEQVQTLEERFQIG